ncbi:U1 protein [Berne virus]|nr:U1 protein [Berne virus]
MLFYIFKFCGFTLFTYGWQFVWLFAQFFVIPIFTVFLLFTVKAIFYLLRLVELSFSTLIIWLIEVLRKRKQQFRRRSLDV